MIEYSSTDASAPILNNSNGSLIAMLYACLVTGYGAKAGAGWTRPFTGTNLAVFRQGTGGNGRYLRVSDAGLSPDTTFRRAQIRGYENMTAVSKGTGAFPSTGQVTTNGQNVNYREIATGLIPRWNVYASSSFVHVIIDASGTAGYWEYFGFGTFISNKAGNTYNDVIIGGYDDTSNGGWTGIGSADGSVGISSSGLYICRSDTGAAGSVIGAVVYSNSGGTYIGAGSSAFPYPDRPTGSLLQIQAEITADGYRQGKIPGMWNVLHIPTTYGHSDIDGTIWTGVSGTELAGKSFKLYGPIARYIANQGYPAFETSNTWS